MTKVRFSIEVDAGLPILQVKRATVILWLPTIDLSINYVGNCQSERNLPVLRFA